MSDCLTADAIDKIAELVLASKKTEVLELPERKGVYALVGPDGRAEIKTAGPAWRHEVLATPAELKNFVLTHRGEKSAIFYNENDLTFVFDENDRRDVASCGLVLSEPFRWLREKSGSHLDQKSVIRTLRVVFRGCLGNSEIIEVLKRLRFTGNGEVEGQVEHGKESLGRSITNAVTGQGALPDEITLNVPVWENHTFRTSIVCAFEVLPAEGAFRITPYPLELRKGLDAGLQDIAWEFTPAKDGPALPPIYRGRVGA